MVQIIFNIIFLLILAFIIILNIGNKTSIDLFFRNFTDVSVVVVVFLSFIAGILYVLCYTTYLKIRKKFRGEKETKGKKPSKDEPAFLSEEPPLPPAL